MMKTKTLTVLDILVRLALVTALAAIVWASVLAEHNLSSEILTNRSNGVSTHLAVCQILSHLQVVSSHCKH